MGDSMVNEVCKLITLMDDKRIACSSKAGEA